MPRHKAPLLLLIGLLAGPTAYAERVQCKSHDYRYNHCDMDTRGSVQLVEQRSGAPCRRGQSWGVDRYGVWVDEGCEGVFTNQRDGRRHQRSERWTNDTSGGSSYREACENTIAGNQCK